MKTSADQRGTEWSPLRSRMRSAASAKFSNMAAMVELNEFNGSRHLLLCQSSRHSGNSVLCPRSVPSTKRLIRLSRESYRENRTVRRFYTASSLGALMPEFAGCGYWFAENAVANRNVCRSDGASTPSRVPVRWSVRCNCSGHRLGRRVQACGAMSFCSISL